MPTAAAPATLAQAVVWGGLVLGLALGVVGQSTRFCVRGAIADWVQLRSPGRLVSWMLAVAVGAIAVQGLVSAGAFDATRTIGWGERFPWLSYLVGGGLFGYGMILAGGCPQRCLVKAGSGNLKALLTLVLVAIASLMTLRGAFAPLRASGLDAFANTLAGSQDLGAVLARGLALPATLLRWLITVAVTVGVLALAWKVRAQLKPAHWIGGIAVGLLVAAALYLTGHIGYIAEHPETLEPAWLGTQSKRPEGLSFAAPLAHALDLLTLWTDKSTVATFGVTLALGVLLGAFASAKLRGDFRLESFQTPRELGAHAAGAVLMGFGGVTALGCSLGNGVTGLALLSSGSLLAVAGICAGARLALGRQQRAPAASPTLAATAT
ncbi:YeeE/YedE family protein [Ramlibacter ginsenosidimutans]|uniref:YeeE/YedE family protein n=1 Tax=Ramlibacter ginsenosidimutans TaxID=502333 RepID=A0A934TRW4_9BURK|nr:YeeE/YedE family protein [Ramlibacter ginsenosidimutans]MBK6006279.1 YeeE/YedE family protein [Ramlibacter ginsenosidimutans]